MGKRTAQEPATEECLSYDNDQWPSSITLASVPFGRCNENSCTSRTKPSVRNARRSGIDATLATVGQYSCPRTPQRLEIFVRHLVHFIRPASSLRLGVSSANSYAQCCQPKCPVLMDVPAIGLPLGSRD